MSALFLIIRLLFVMVVLLWIELYFQVYLILCPNTMYVYLQADRYELKCPFLLFAVLVSVQFP